MAAKRCACGAFTTKGPRCSACEARHQAERNASRPHYAGDYRARARALRAAANADPSTTCWLCGGTARPDDPWTADHVVAGDPASELRPAHKSCNSARGARPADEVAGLGDF